ncbi:MAG: RNA polymerase sigma factor [Clostridiales bacterium]|nr:RNA polymerase sigma factor [Clostridiales bacterium]
MEIDELYNKYENALLRFAKSLTGNREESEDLVQETFLRAMANCALLSTLTACQVKSWLYRVLKNCLIDKKRKQKFEILSDPGDDTNNYSIESEVELRIISGEALSALSARDREIVYKKYWMGMTSREIASCLSIPDSTVRYRISMAIKQLKNKYMSKKDKEV